MYSKQKLALFDFDGTITTKDSLFDFLLFYKGPVFFYLSMGLLTPIFGLLFLKLIPNWKAKELMLTWFLKNESHANFNHRCNQYSEHHLPRLIREKALDEILKKRNKNMEVVVVTASPENWVKPWCHAIGIHCIGTKLQITNSKITGKIDGRNCYGDEKVNRIKAAFNLKIYDVDSAYGDSSGDKPMLNLAHNKFYKPFR